MGLFAIVILTALKLYASFPVFSSLSDIPIDHENLVDENIILFEDTEDCSSAINNLQHVESSNPYVKFYAISHSFSESLFATSLKANCNSQSSLTCEVSCSFAFIEKGSPLQISLNVYPEAIYHLPVQNSDLKGLLSWYSDIGLKKEVGFVSMLQFPLTVAWYDASSDYYHDLATISFQDGDPVWIEAFLGDRFRVYRLSSSSSRDDSQNLLAGTSLENRK